jgi:4-hydroxybenzoate polyprenyltransferase
MSEFPSSAGIVSSDAPARNWVDRYAPAGLRPWLRLARYDRPIGSWLLLMPCWWSAALAANTVNDTRHLVWHLVLFFVGAFVMRGAGSTWNDILDRKIDAQVERTRSRPIASGQIRVKPALAYAVLQSLVGLLILLQFNGFTIGLGCLSLLPVAVYPLMKRVMWAPQAVLAIAFAWGALMGWAGLFGSLSWPAVVLYLGSCCWVVGYDTIYGHQDQRDDAIIGIKSTSRLFGSGSRTAVASLYVATVLLIGLSLILSEAGLASAIGLAAFAVHLMWQITRMEPDDPSVCLRLFRSNRDAGLLLFAGILVDAVFFP